MRCLSCQTSGKHFQYKICPQCTSEGITKDDVKYIVHEMYFIGELSGLDADQYIKEHRAKVYITHLEKTFKEHGYDPRKNKTYLSWREYTGGKNGRKKEAINANKS